MAFLFSALNKKTPINTPEKSKARNNSWHLLSTNKTNPGQCGSQRLKEVIKDKCACIEIYSDVLPDVTVKME
jgi:hypothetical protein